MYSFVLFLFPDDAQKLQPAAQKYSSPGLMPPDVQPKKSGNACKPVTKRESLRAEPESTITQVRLNIHKLKSKKQWV